MSMPAHKIRRRLALFVIAYCVIVAAALLSGCETTQPTPFSVGAPVQAPQGCIDGRARGVDC